MTGGATVWVVYHRYRSDTYIDVWANEQDAIDAADRLARDGHVCQVIAKQAKEDGESTDGI